MKTYDYDENAIESAIYFLAYNFTRSGNNPKPVILHSIRVANLLWANGASQKSVVAAVLHDVLEDTAITPDEIEDIFGKDIRDIVQSLTFDTGSDDYEYKLKAAKRSFYQSEAIGLEALWVRAADLIDNSYYYQKSTTTELNTYLKHKYELFMNISQSQLSDAVIWDLLNEAYELNVKNL